MLEGVLESAAIDHFRSRLQGEVLRPGEHHYDDARRVFNAAIDKAPALIARCASVADVVTAIRFAREHRLLVAVRGGGHNVAGNALCDGGLVIDLSRMTAVRVDPAKRRARTEGGSHRASSTVRPRCSGWRLPAESCPRRASRG